MFIPRRKFIKAAAAASGIALLKGLPFSSVAAPRKKKGVKLCAHLWVYASKFPPQWDATPVLDKVFSDLKYAGYDGVELMEVNLRHEDAVARLRELSRKHKIGVSGTSYSAPMWNRDKHADIVVDVDLITSKLRDLGATTFGITTGKVDHKKTEAELDAQAVILKMINGICRKKKLVANLHNHTWEVEHDLHELKGMMSRVPDLKLGPDLNWLVRGGVDPVWFIENYGTRMAYMHLRDQRADGKWTEAVGEGVMNFPAIAAALRKINYKGWAGVELAYDTPVERIERENWKISREYVRKVFGW
jgi:sugar phosphate isomerase/epimerase